MSDVANIASNAMTALQMKPLNLPFLAHGDGRVGESRSGKTEAAMDKAAKEFETVFIGQMLGAMFSGIQSNGITGGGQGEDMFRSLLVDEYSKGIQSQGGIGIAAAVKAQMLKMQEI